MLVLVAIDAQVFPVRTIGGIIQMISVFVMHRKKVPVFDIEFPPALGADQTMNLQGLFPVIGLRCGILSQLFYDFGSALVFGRLMLP
jgi:hypothetical protein